MRYLLDTNIVSNLIKDPRGPITQKVASVGEQQVCTSIVVAAELRYGAHRKSSARLTAQVEAVLAALEVLPLEAPVDRIYGELRVELERAGVIIGGNDLLIAAHAMTLGYVVVTDNEREFSRVEGLKCENWLRA